MKIFLTFFIWLFISYPAIAYIDPGSGSILLQILGSIAVGFLVFFRTLKMYIIDFMNKVKNFFKSLFKKIKL